MSERPQHHDSQPSFTRRAVISLGLGAVTFGGIFYVLGGRAPEPQVAPVVIPKQPTPESKPKISEYQRLEQKIKGFDVRARSRQEFESNAQEVVKEAVAYYSNEIFSLTGERSDQSLLLSKIKLHKNKSDFTASVAEETQSCEIKPSVLPDALAFTGHESRKIDINLSKFYDDNTRGAHQQLFGTLIHELSHGDIKAQIPPVVVTIEDRKVLWFNGFYIKLHTGQKPIDKEVCQGEIGRDIEEAYAEFIAQKLLRKVNIVRDTNPYLRLAGNMERLLSQLRVKDPQIERKMISLHRRSEIFEFAKLVAIAGGYVGNNELGQGLTFLLDALAA